jgi:hypothetical protein
MFFINTKHPKDVNDCNGVKVVRYEVIITVYDNESKVFVKHRYIWDE